MKANETLPNTKLTGLKISRFRSNGLLLVSSSYLPNYKAGGRWWIDQNLEDNNPELDKQIRRG